MPQSKELQKKWDGSLAYTGDGNTIDLKTMRVGLPEPDVRIDLAMGEEHLSFTMREAFEAVAKLLGIEVA